MKASAYFVRLAERAAQPARGFKVRAALGAETLSLRSAIRLTGRTAPGVDLRSLRRTLAWQLRAKPKAAVPTVATVANAAPSTVLRHTERLQMFAITRIERLSQQFSAPRLPELVLLRPPAASVRAAASRPLAPTRHKFAHPPGASILQQTIAIHPSQLRQIWLREAAATLPLAQRAAVAASPLPQVSQGSSGAASSPLPSAARRAESAAPQWLTPRLQRLSQHHFTTIGRAVQALTQVMAVTRESSKQQAPAKAWMRFAPPAAPTNTRSTRATEIAPNSSAQAPTAPRLSSDMARASSTRSAAMPAARIVYRNAVLPVRPPAMYSPFAQVAVRAVSAARIAPSLIARASAPHVQAQAGAKRSAGNTSAATTLPWQAVAAAAVAQANATANLASNGLNMAAGNANSNLPFSATPALPLHSANPFVSATTPSATPARTPSTAPEQEWVQAVQRVIFTRHVLDKVADDVVAKIEKRVRIERERRGI